MTKVGNSSAFIIPVKILRQMGISESTRFELALESDGSLHIRKSYAEGYPVFPKTRRLRVSDAEMAEFAEGLIVTDPEQDERTAYILSR